MIKTVINDFTVDMQKRTASHKSGAVVSFYEYETEADWLAAGICNVSNPDLYGGSIDELGAVARRAALAAGMTHQKPR